MAIITIQFNAFIAKTLGEKLVDIVKRKDPRIDTISNKKAILDELSAVPHYWFVEPGQIGTPDKYTMTDSRLFNYSGTHRLGMVIQFDSDDVLKKEILNTPPKLVTASVGESERYKLDYSAGAATATNEKATAPLKETAEYKKPFFKNIFRSNISTAPTEGFALRKRISAAYPFVLIAPDIDIHLYMVVTKVGLKTSIRLSGSHDQFPYYEIIVNNKLLYTYDPMKHGWYGPRLDNLSIIERYSVDIMI